MNVLMLPDRQLFICDTYVNRDPTRRAARRDDAAGRRGGAPLRPDAEGRAAVAFELRQLATRLGAQDARGARAASRERAPELEVEGEMHGDAALSRAVLEKIFPDSRLKGEANLLIMPNARRRQHRLQRC